MSPTTSSSANQPATNAPAMTATNTAYQIKIRQHQILQALKEHRLNQIPLSLTSLKRAIDTNNNDYIKRCQQQAHEIAEKLDNKLQPQNQSSKASKVSQEKFQVKRKM